MPKVFVTGATGFVGSHVVEHLRDKGYDVQIIARNTSKMDFLPDGIALHRCSLTDPSPICNELATADYFIHIAGLTKARNKKEFYDVNAETVRIWLETLERTAPGLKRFVLVSSLAAIRPSNEPISEDAEPAPLTDYGKSKLLGEKYAQQFMKRLPITIIRPPAVYGPRDKDIFFYFKLASKKILPLVGNPERKFSAIYIEDLAEAIFLAMENRAAIGETFFVTDGEPHTWREFADEVGHAIGGRQLKIRLPCIALRIAALFDETISFILRRPALLSFQKVRELLDSWVANGSEIQRKLGFVPKYDLKAGVAKTAKWYRDNQWIK